MQDVQKEKKKNCYKNFFNSKRMFWYIRSDQDYSEQWKIKYFTVSKIKRATTFKAKNKFKFIEIEEIRGKLDVSELWSIGCKYERNWNKLLNVGYGIYSIDCTKDFSATLDRENLIDHFLTKRYFRIKKTEGQYGNQPCILENTRSAGANVVTYVISVSTFTMSVKYYKKNKVKFWSWRCTRNTSAHLAK